MKVSDFGRYRSCCIRNNFFTAGTNEQYEKVYELMKKGITIHDLAMLTWLCSSGSDLEQIRFILQNEFRRL